MTEDCKHEVCEKCNVCPDCVKEQTATRIFKKLEDANFLDGEDIMIEKKNWQRIKKKEGVLWNVKNTAKKIVRSARRADNAYRAET